MSPYVEQVAEALTKALHGDTRLRDGYTAHFAVALLAPLVDAALMRAYWQGWDDGHAERGKIQPSGAAGRGVLAALGELRVSHTPTPEPPQ